MELYEELEEKLKVWSGCNDVVVCSSGTAALHLALEVLQLPPHSKIATCDYTMIAVPRAITLAEHVPVFIDCDKSLTMDRSWGNVAFLDYDEVKAVIAVHTYGRKIDFQSLLPRCSDAKIFVIEDLAEAHGVKPSPLSNAAVYSFYKNKIIHGEEGGAIGFRNPEHAKLARQLRSLGFTEDHDFIHVPRGHNYRMSNLHAKPILESLSHFTENLRTRKWIERGYDDVCPPSFRMPKRDVPWVYDIRIPGIDFYTQGLIVTTLNDKGIQARHGFKSMTLQPEYRCYTNPKTLPNSIRASSEVIYLPIDPRQAYTHHTYPRAFEIINDVLKGCGYKVSTS